MASVPHSGVLASYASSTAAGLGSGGQPQQVCVSVGGRVWVHGCGSGCVGMCELDWRRLMTRGSGCLGM
eukprot:1158087-Pelagomonas_calceolata.AAC.2